MRLVVASLFLVSCVNAAVAAPPTLRELRPWGAERGHAITLTVVGDRLAAGGELLSVIPGKLEAEPGANAGQVTYKLELRGDAPVGLYPIRLRTPGGLSNPLYFSVGDLPEVAEAEPNDTPPGSAVLGVAADTAAVLATLTLPTTVNGSAAGTDQDVFRIAGKKGQRLVAEVEARRIGSVLDPAVHLLTAQGRELAFSDDTPGLGLDCRVDVTLPEDGDYYVVVHDSKYAGGSPAHYRLKLGSFAYAESIFPLGWQRGRDAELSLLGGTYSAPGRLKLHTAADAAQVLVPASLEGPQARLPFHLVLGDEPETIEPEGPGERWFRDAAIMNGRIAQPGEVDRYNFPVQAGQNWVFSVEAASLGARLDPLLSVLDPQGNRLAGADDAPGNLDPRLTLQAPGGMDHVVLVVEDLHGRGGPGFGYRLIARPARTNFALRVVPQVVNIPRRGSAVVQVQAVRDGYNGPIQLSVPERLDGISAEGGEIAQGAQDGFLVLSAAGDTALRMLDLEILGQGGPRAKPMERRAVPPPRNAYAAPESVHVPAAVCEPPPVLFSVADRSVRVLHGHSSTLKITAERTAAATEAIAVNGTGVPPGLVSGTAGTIAKEANELTLTLQSSPENPAVGVFTMQLAATTQVAGTQETIQLRPIRVEVARPFHIEVLDRDVNIAVGSKKRLAAIVRREAPFDGVVKVGPIGGLPQHVSLSAVEVPKGESLALVELSVADAATPAEFDIQVRASAEMEGRKRDKDYVIPDSTVHVKIVPKPGS